MSEASGRKSADKNKSRPLSSRKSGGIKNSNISSDPKNSFRSNSILSKEEEYKRLNAELEAKTANLVKEAEEVLREQDSILTNPSLLDNINTDDFLQNLDDDDSRPVSKTQSRPSSKISVNRNGSRPSSSASAAAADPGVISPKRPLSKTKKTSAKSRPRSGKADDVAVPDDAFLTDCQNFSKLTIQDTIANIEGRLNTNSPGDEDDELDDDDVGDDIIPQAANEMGSEATIRFLKAKLRVMQEELDRLAEENNKKEETVNSLHGKIKELEEERGRLHRTNAAQQSQIDKFKKVADESRTKSENTETQLSALRKELEQMKRQAKQQTSNQSATEVRLNRALEEIEKQKEQLYRAKSSTKDSAEQDRRRMDQLVADNKRLEKQKNELMAGFKKQLKLIDILKRQKMHIEAAKMLSFSEEEFVKALEWGS